jgi:hypothetical protein
MPTYEVDSGRVYYLLILDEFTDLSILDEFTDLSILDEFTDLLTSCISVLTKQIVLSQGKGTRSV